MIDFLVASKVKGNVDKLILLSTIPLDLNSTLRVIRNADSKSVQQTRLDVEDASVIISPANYLENIDQYVLHVQQRAAKDSITVSLYKVERDAFRSIRKFIINQSHLLKGKVPC